MIPLSQKLWAGTKDKFTDAVEHNWGELLPNIRNILFRSIDER